VKSCFAVADCGTSAVKAALIDERGTVRGMATEPCRVDLRLGGRAETDIEEMERAVLSCLRRSWLSARLSPKCVSAVCVTNQRATIVCVGRDGEPLGKAISWQDRRGEEEIQALRRRIPDDQYYAITGTPNHPVFSLGKIL
jgi:sugar (pentulose or hexulose) kinase